MSDGAATGPAFGDGSDDIVEYMYELMDRNAPVVTIPEAHHHLILDQPIAFVAALSALVADWAHSIPQRRSLAGG